LRDFTHGRLYRIGWKNAPKYTPISLSKSRPDELVATLKNSNMLWRRHAQRLLVERGNKDVVAKLVELVKDKSVDEIGLNTAAIHALWTLEGLNAISDPQVLPVVLEALKHPSNDVRKTAVKVLPRTAATGEALLTADALHDKEPLVVLNTLLAFSEIPLTPQIETAVLALLDNYSNAEDRWMPTTVHYVPNTSLSVLRKQVQPALPLSKLPLLTMPTIQP
jgi:hypothetical protein